MSIMEQHNDKKVIDEMEQFIKREEKKEWMLPAAIVFAALVIGAAFIYGSGSRNAAPVNDQAQQQAEVAPKVASDEPVRGKADAPVTIIEFGDFQCPYCGKFFAEVEPFIKSAFIDTGKAKMVYKPLAFLGQESVDAATAAECAADQGKFWEMHDAIFGSEYKDVEALIAGKIKSSENNGNLTLELFKKLGAGFGLDQDAFATCYASGTKKAILTARMTEAEQVMPEGISTPTVFINGKRIDPRILYDKQALTALIDGLTK